MDSTIELRELKTTAVCGTYMRDTTKQNLNPVAWKITSWRLRNGETKNFTKAGFRCRTFYEPNLMHWISTWKVRRLNHAIALHTVHRNVTPHPPRLWQTLAISARGRKNVAWKRTVCDHFCSQFSVFRNVPVSKFEERPGKCNVEQIKTLFKCKGLTEHLRKTRELLNAVSRYLICSPACKCFHSHQIL